MFRRNLDQGSALVMAIFVLALLSTMGIALMFLSGTEVKMSQASLSAKQVYYLSEGGLEDGRTMIYEINKTSPDPQDLTEELTKVAGSNGVLDFNPANLAPVYDTDGNFTGFTGYGDDVPITPVTALTDGWYAAFVTNDPGEGETVLTDADDRVMVTGIAVRNDRSVEMVHAIVARPDTFAVLPSTITLLGPTPTFEGGKSAAKFYTGNEAGGHCPTGGAEMPVVGVIGSAAEASVEAGIDQPNNYIEGSSPVQNGVDTVDDLTLLPDLPELWTNCDLLVELAGLIKEEADVVGNADTPVGSLGFPGVPKIVYIDDDYDISGGFHGAGLLWVTGHLTMDGNANWDGPIWVVGEGDFLRDGAGNGDIAGGIVVADVAGPDRVLFTDDDCSGEDDVMGTSDDGVAQGSYIVNGSGSSTTGYCAAYVNPWQSLRPFPVVSFLQD